MSPLLQLSILSIANALYVVYILNFFKTKYSLAHPLTYFENDFFYHPIGKSRFPENKICSFGHLSSWILAVFILFRLLLLLNNMKYKLVLRKISIILLVLAIVLSFMNFNAVIYLIPYFIVESIIINNYF